MSTLNDPAYYRRRAEQARAFAAKAASPEIRGIHLDMALRYAELLQQVEPPRLVVRAC